MEREQRSGKAGAIAATAVLALAAGVSGCRYAKPNSNCEWPQQVRQSSLREEAEYAEDLSIRYADVRRRGRADFYQIRNQCMARLFQVVGDRHGRTPWQVWQSLQRRPPGLDAAEMLSFGALYALAAYFLARYISRRYPGREGRWGRALMTVYLSLAVAVAGVLVGEVWCQTMESLRLGTGHLSYRVARLPWGHHYVALFLCSVALVWLVAALENRLTQASPRLLH